MYFSSLFPYVVLACFLVRGLLLRGAVDGILHMFTPKVGARPVGLVGITGSRGKGRHIYWGEIRGSVREEVTRELSLGEQGGLHEPQEGVLVKGTA